MAWSNPTTYLFVSDEIPPATKLNKLWEDIEDLHRRTTTVSAHIGQTSALQPESTASTTYVDLATVGPAVPVEVGSTGLVLITLSAHMENDTVNGTCYMALTAAGANTLAAYDEQAFAFTSPAAGGGIRSGITFPIGGLNSSLTTFGSQFRVDSGTGTFDIRRISGTALGS